jgi:hypothetical protein
MKRIKTSVARALEKGQLKVGDKIFIEMEVTDINFNDKLYPLEFDGRWIRSYSKNILITKPEPKKIDFAAEGRVLKSGNDIVKTTGLQIRETSFSAYVLESEMYKKGQAADNWSVVPDWQDITDTYKN